MSRTTRALVHDAAAREDLIEIWVYTCRTWGPEQADRYLGLLENGIHKITKRPEGGQSRAELRAGYWSARLEHHMAFYTFDNEEVRIRRVLHEGMDHPRHV